MFCHNKPLFRARSKGLGRLAHSVYYLEQNKMGHKTILTPQIKDGSTARPIHATFASFGEGRF